MPSNHLILCHPLLLLPPIPPSIRVFSNESTLHIRWPKYWSFSFSIIPSKQPPGLISLEWTGWISLQSKGLSRVFSSTTVQKHQFFRTSTSQEEGTANKTPRGGKHVCRPFVKRPDSMGSLPSAPPQVFCRAWELCAFVHPLYLSGVWLPHL